jgi:hypothetical protein
VEAITPPAVGTQKKKPTALLKRLSAGVLLLGLSGCGAIFPAGPMSKEAAGELYLSHVCKSNASSDELSSLIETPPLDLAAAKKKASTVRADYLRTAEDFSSKDIVWPDNVKEDITAFVDATYDDVAAVNPMATSPDEASFKSSAALYRLSQIGGKSQGGLSQKIRARLGLSPDQVASCKGH